MGKPSPQNKPLHAIFLSCLIIFDLTLIGLTWLGTVIKALPVKFDPSSIGSNKTPGGTTGGDVVLVVGDIVVSDDDVVVCNAEVVVPGIEVVVTVGVMVVDCTFNGIETSRPEKNSI